MCILFCYLSEETRQFGYQFILLSNRDEDFERPALPAHLWSGTQFVIGGQDQTSAREGGTWLCLNTVQGRAGVLVNLPSRMTPERKAQAQSRGFIVPNFVNDSQIDLDSYMDELQKTKMNYTGFNFLALEQTPKSTKWRAKYINNSRADALPMEISAPLFGFSNHVYGDEFAFLKTKTGCQLFEQILQESSENYTKTIKDENQFIQRLFDLLSNHTVYADDANVGTTYSHYTAGLREQISSICVRTSKEAPAYGTRTSTIILIREDQSGLFIEKTLTDPLVDPTQWSERRWSFQLHNSDEPPQCLT